jgi:hypothetical protein
MNKHDTQKISLEDIALRKAKLLEEIRAQKIVIVETARLAFNPYSRAVTTGSSLMKTLNTGMAVFEGAMLGLKIMRKVRRFFG